jgi:hypothetical protein
LLLAVRIERTTQGAAMLVHSRVRLAGRSECQVYPDKPWIQRRKEGSGRVPRRISYAVDKRLTGVLHLPWKVRSHLWRSDQTSVSVDRCTCAQLLTASAGFQFHGISPSAWEDAQSTMGEIPAAIVLAAILQRGSAIRSAAGYLRGLMRKAEAGEFSLGPMLMALIGARHTARGAVHKRP